MPSGARTIRARISVNGDRPEWCALTGCAATVLLARPPAARRLVAGEGLRGTVVNVVLVVLVEDREVVVAGRAP